MDSQSMSKSMSVSSSSQPEQLPAEHLNEISEQTSDEAEVTSRSNFADIDGASRSLGDGSEFAKGSCIPSEQSETLPSSANIHKAHSSVHSYENVFNDTNTAGGGQKGFVAHMSDSETHDYSDSESKELCDERNGRPSMDTSLASSGPVLVAVDVHHVSLESSRSVHSTASACFPSVVPHGARSAEGEESDDTMSDRSCDDSSGFRVEEPRHGRDHSFSVSDCQYTDDTSENHQTSEGLSSGTACRARVNCRESEVSSSFSDAPRSQTHLQSEAASSVYSSRPLESNHMSGEQLGVSCMHQNILQNVDTEISLIQPVSTGHQVPTAGLTGLVPSLMQYNLESDSESHGSDSQDLDNCPMEVAYVVKQIEHAHIADTYVLHRYDSRSSHAGYIKRVPATHGATVIFKTSGRSTQDTIPGNLDATRSLDNEMRTLTENETPNIAESFIRSQTASGTPPACDGNLFSYEALQSSIVSEGSPPQDSEPSETYSPTQGISRSIVSTPSEVQVLSVPSEQPRLPNAVPAESSSDEPRRVHETSGELKRSTSVSCGVEGKEAVEESVVRYNSDFAESYDINDAEVSDNDAYKVQPLLHSVEDAECLNSGSEEIALHVIQASTVNVSECDEAFDRVDAYPIPNPEEQIPKLRNKTSNQSYETADGQNSETASASVCVAVDANSSARNSSPCSDGEKMVSSENSSVEREVHGIFSTDEQKAVDCHAGSYRDGKDTSDANQQLMAQVKVTAAAESKTDVEIPPYVCNQMGLITQQPIVPSGHPTNEKLFSDRDMGGRHVKVINSAPGRLDGNSVQPDCAQLDRVPVQPTIIRRVVRPLNDSPDGVNAFCDKVCHSLVTSTTASYGQFEPRIATLIIPGPSEQNRCLQPGMPHMPVVGVSKPHDASQLYRAAPGNVTPIESQQNDFVSNDESKFPIHAHHIGSNLDSSIGFVGKSAADGRFTVQYVSAILAASQHSSHRSAALQQLSSMLVDPSESSLKAKMDAMRSAPHSNIMLKERSRNDSVALNHTGYARSTAECATPQVSVRHPRRSVTGNVSASSHFVSSKSRYSGMEKNSQGAATWDQPEGTWLKRNINCCC